MLAGPEDGEVVRDELKLRVRGRIGPPAWALIVAGLGVAARAAAETAPPQTGSDAPPRPPRSRSLEISEFRVEGADHLSQLEVEAAIYPDLGPNRTLEDVERARAALEKAYSDKGFQSVTVAIPPQTVKGGVVVLKVSEGKVGRLRVRGSRWSSLSGIKRQATSVAEGSLPDFNAIVRDVFLLNQLPDRRVTPALRAGAQPGTIDVDLNVEDHLPLHGALEFDNRASANTTPARLNSSLRYDNLWQSGHSLSLALQIAPRRLRDATVFSASYLARLPEVPWLTFSANAILQNSDISTLGSTAVQGRGRIFGARANFTLPITAAFFQSLSAGADYKHFGKELLSDLNAAPITYWPFSTQYMAGFTGESSQTQGSATLVTNLRGLSSGQDQFDAKRFKASGNFIYLRAELARTEEIGRGAQLAARVQTQVSTGPLLPSEQLAAGGAESIRGYLEAQAAGDHGVFGSLEARSPSLALARWIDECKALVFADGGRLGIRDRLVEQQSIFFLWSTGAGVRFRALKLLSGALDAGVPLRSEGTTKKYHPRIHFRIGAEF